MARSTPLVVIGVSLVALAPGATVLTQATQDTGAGTRPMMSMYDTKTETTVRGTVESVDEVTGAGPMGGGMMKGRTMGGTHIVLKTDEGAVTVHLGPTSFLEENNLKLAAGDTVEVLGSRVSMGGQDVVLAREIARGETRLTLRDESGRPRWRMGPR